jgi:tRNA(Glu) U13 pseudouridine synthase TruD
MINFFTIGFLQHYCFDVLHTTSYNLFLSMKYWLFTSTKNGIDTSKALAILINVSKVDLWAFLSICP